MTEKKFTFSKKIVNKKVKIESGKIKKCRKKNTLKL